MTLTIGCDPSAKPDISVWYGETLTNWMTLKNINELKVALDALIATLNINDKRVFACEMPYYLVKNRNWVSFSKQCRNIGRIEQIALDYGYEFVEITPAEWQSSLPCGARAVREQLKGASIKVASAIAGTEIKSHNQADAINIGGDQARKETFKSKIKRKF